MNYKKNSIFFVKKIFNYVLNFKRHNRWLNLDLVSL